MELIAFIIAIKKQHISVNSLLGRLNQYTSHPLGGSGAK
jgi:hypothetical protein